MNFNQTIKCLFEDGTLNGKTIKQIFNYFNAKKGFEKDAVRGSISLLEKEGVVFCIDGKYLTFATAGLIRGVIRGQAKGYAFFTPSESENPPESIEKGDLFIPPHALKGAMDGDEVYARKVVSNRGSDDEGEVVHIIKRLTVLVGTFQLERTYGFVISDRKGYNADIFVTFKNAHGAVTGDKVIVKIFSFPEGKNPEGEITEVLGKKYDIDAQEKAVIAERGIPDVFPEKVKEFVAENVPSSVEYVGEDREDFRGDLIITIDGESAKDLDDAVSVKKNENGNYMLSVHISDVTHYVSEGSSLDKEALKRGTSVYFPDTVIPMLPRELSNGVCSLNESEDRLTLSCIMEVDSDGQVVDRRIVKGVIRSCRRMTYNAVDAILNGNEDLIKEYGDIVPLVKDMAELADILITKRQRRGSVDLDVKDADIYVDGRGEIVVNPLNRTFSHRIIEEFMILANETAAEYAQFTEIPFLYRVHDAPSGEKLEIFKDFLKNLGINVKWNKSGVFSSDFAAILEKIEGSPLFPLVNRVMLRSMCKAKYSPENVGHFGLASERYCHFTSPIRRYPDIIVHRALKYLIDGRIGEWVDRYSPIIAEIGRISSECERRADEAERTVDDIFKGRYMKKFIGEQFEGVVSGVTSFGVFVELENTCEGLIKTDTLPAGSYDYDKKAHSLIGKNASFRIGEKVVIQVAGVESLTGKVEFIFINKPL